MVFAGDFADHLLFQSGKGAKWVDRSAVEIDRVIEACVDGFQDSMRRQAAAQDPIDDEIPF